jgi:ferritin-like metal-binding protein YciE
MCERRRAGNWVAHTDSRGLNLIANQLKRIYVQGLRLLYSAESQLKDALPQMARGPSAEELRTWLTGRLEQAKEHVAGLGEIFSAIQESPKGERCGHMEHLLAEGIRIMRKRGAPEKLDRQLIAIAQGIEGQEIAGFRWVCAYAGFLHEDAALSVLGKMLEEERIMALRLAQLSGAIEAKAAGVDRIDGSSGALRKASMMDTG